MIDTDGSIYIAKRDKRLSLIFKNGSLPLVKDFKEMCECLGIKTGKVIKILETSRKSGIKSECYYTQIQSKAQVKKFIGLIRPKRWECGINEISEKLSKMGLSLKDALNYKRSK